MSEIYDFRNSKVGETIVVATERGSFSFTKDSEASALEGWALIQDIGDIAVRFVVMEPPFMTSSAVVRTGYELAIEREDDPNIIRSLGENPSIMRSSMHQESAAA